MRYIQGLFLVLFIAVVGCQTVSKPTEDYVIARAALDAAKQVEAARYSPGFWNQAEEAYRKAKIFYDDREYEAAKKEFIKAKMAAEKAENSARLIRLKNGEVL